MFLSAKSEKVCNKRQDHFHKEEIHIITFKHEKKQEETKMKEFTYVITDDQGIHARPAGEFVKLAKTVASDVQIGKAGKFVNAKKPIGVMSLGIKKGEEAAIKVEGEDEEATAAALESFLKENL